MSGRVFVVQAVASGPDGYPYDEIVDIAVCSVDPSAGDFDTVYSGAISYEPRRLGKRKLDYLEEVAGICAGDLYGGDPEAEVAGEVMKTISGGSIACFDARQEFGRYMTCDPWDITMRAEVMPSVSSRLPVSLKPRDPSDEPMAIRKAYSKLLPHDPACVGRGRRAVHLAQMTSQILIDLRARGKY
ncbi:MAG: hypothetical protein LBG62_05105 [Candidatus Methanoplasma sp.]|jgi:hypothetical protein|nr:hypothetical protein [Candidatus Methanoplasma sp.]